MTHEIDSLQATVEELQGYLDDATFFIQEINNQRRKSEEAEQQKLEAERKLKETEH